MTGGWFSFASQVESCECLGHAVTTGFFRAELPGASVHTRGCNGAGDHDCAGPRWPGRIVASKGESGCCPGRMVAERPLGLTSALSAAISHDNDIDPPLVSPATWQAAVVATDIERGSVPKMPS